MTVRILRDKLKKNVDLESKPNCTLSEHGNEYLEVKLGMKRTPGKNLHSYLLLPNERTLLE